ncbi:MAG: GNAT family N-acetyltransferase [Promethearchaeota archaeon]
MLKKYNVYRTLNDKIIFRNFKEGDEEGLAVVFNRAFQQNGGSFLRTPNTFYWRYVRYPDYEPEIINLAEDTENNKIVGSVMGNVQEEFFNGKKYLVGVVNDVSTLPGYGGKGIARNLVKMALNYFISKGADIASLGADPNGFPRSKIYIPLGFKDITKAVAIFYFTNFKTLIRQIPLIIPLIPLIFPLRLPYYIKKLKYLSLYKKKKTKYIIEIKKNTATEEFRRRFNEVAPKIYDGVHIFSKEEWKWARIDVPIKMFRPIQIVIRDKGTKKIVAGAILTAQNIYASKFGIKIRLAPIKNFFVDYTFLKMGQKKNEHNQNNKIILKELKEIYELLYIGIISASIHKENAVTIGLFDKNDVLKIHCAKLMGFVPVVGGTHMMKDLKKRVEDLGIKKPIYVDPGENLGAF